MAWTVTRFGPIINLVPDGSTDFNFLTHFPDEPEGLQVEEIQVYFSAANDVVSIRNGGLTGPQLFKYTTLDGSSVAKRFYGGLLKLYLEHDDQTYSTAANWVIIIQTT